MASLTSLVRLHFQFSFPFKIVLVVSEHLSSYSLMAFQNPIYISNFTSNPPSSSNGGYGGNPYGYSNLGYRGYYCGYNQNQTYPQYAYQPSEFPTGFSNFPSSGGYAKSVYSKHSIPRPYVAYNLHPYSEYHSYLHRQYYNSFTSSELNWQQLEVNVALSGAINTTSSRDANGRKLCPNGR